MPDSLSQGIELSPMKSVRLCNFLFLDQKLINFSICYKKYTMIYVQQP